MEPMRKQAISRRKNKPAQAVCNVCGASFDPDAPLTPFLQMIHVMTEHPAEFVSSDSGKALLSRVEFGAFEFGQRLSKMIRGEK